MPDTGDFLRPVRVGEKFRPKAAAWNAFLDAARAHRRSRFSGAGPAATEAGDFGVVTIHNASGNDVDWLGVLGIDVATVLPSDNADQFRADQVLDGITPAAASHLGKFAIALTQIPAGGIGDALVCGVTAVRLSIDDAAHTLADVLDGDTTQLLSSTTGSATILWKESGTGASKWAIVRLGGNRLPTPQYKGMVLQGVAQNQIGFDWTQATPMTPP